MMRLDFAPLDGITRSVYRRVWQEHFGGADRLFIPFFSPTPQHLLTNRDRRELEPGNNPPLSLLVPQIMTREAPDLIWASQVAADLGYREVNLNLGCPSGTVTAKGKGAGFLAQPEALDRFFDGACGKLALPLSVKTRLGIREVSEFPALLEVFNRYPFTSLIIHVRVARDKYRGTLHPEVFEEALKKSTNPLSFNGDIQTTADANALFHRFPLLEAVMIGRGAVADPALFRKLRGGPPATREELRAFTGVLFQEYRSFYGQIGHAAQRMREVWFYLIHLFENAEKLNKRLRRFRTPDEFLETEAAIFQELPLRDHCEGPLY